MKNNVSSTAIIPAKISQYGTFLLFGTAEAVNAPAHAAASRISSFSLLCESK